MANNESEITIKFAQDACKTMRSLDDRLDRLEPKIARLESAINQLIFAVEGLRAQTQIQRQALRR